MITDADIAHWRSSVPCVDPDQVEQDLVLSRMIVEIANDPLLGPELVFRGGTCFHKLWLDRPWRYSEDLDYVRTTSGGVGEILTALRSIGERVGFERVNTAIGQHPKARFRSTFATGDAMTIKIEINTFERSPARPIVRRGYGVDSPWFTGHAEVPTFDLAELIATKIRALFQRKKGRDLFDLWLAVRQAGVAPEDIAACFEPYRPDGWSAGCALDNLHAKLDDAQFVRDLGALIGELPEGYTVEDASRLARNVIALTA
ncbi:MAG: nucleotidyl transferase AbiEii/AbiGii toxin family protein [Ilumatobacteraceae bacterium]